MHKRATLLTMVLACVLVGALAFAVAACGGGNTTTTTAPADTATTLPARTATTVPAGTDTSAATPSTAAGGGFTIPSIQMTSDVQLYLNMLMTALGPLQSLPDTTDPLKMDPATVTDTEIASAVDAVAQVQKVVDTLKTLTPPDSLKTVHESLIAAISSEVVVASKAIDALKNKDQAALAAAATEADKIGQQLNDFFSALIPLMSGGTATT